MGLRKIHLLRLYQKQRDMGVLSKMSREEVIFVMICIIGIACGIVSTYAENNYCFDEYKNNIICGSKPIYNVNEKNAETKINYFSQMMRLDMIVNSTSFNFNQFKDNCSLNNGIFSVQYPEYCLNISNLELCYTFNDSSIIDYSGKGNNAVNNGTVFNSTDNTYLFIHDAAHHFVNTTFTTNKLGSYTILLWVKVFATATTVNNPNFYSAQDTGASRFYGRFDWTTGENYSKWGVSSWNPAISGYAINKNIWHSVIVRLNSTNGDIWIDGTRIANQSGITVANPNSQILLGIDMLLVNNMNGSFKSFVVYNRSFSDQEVLNWNNQGVYNLSCNIEESINPWQSYNETLGSYWINQTTNQNHELLDDIKEEMNLIAIVLLWLGMWSIGFWAFQSYNDLLGGTMLVLTIPIDIYFMYAFREVLMLGTGFMGVAFGIMAAFTLGIIMLIKRRNVVLKA